jgi:hypothetical protein
VLDPRRPARRPDNRDQIKTVWAIARRVSHQEVLRRVFYAAPLERPRRLLQVLGTGACAGFHLSENNGVTLHADEVNLPSRTTVVAGEDAMAVTL